MAPESQSDAAGGDAQAADGNDPLAELDALEGRMRGFGLATATDKLGADAATSANDDGVGDGEQELGSEKGPARERDDMAEATEVTAAPAVNERPSPEEEIGSRCGDLCDLSESICMLEVRICSLSESHTADPIYADACERAVDDCYTAGEACDRCDA